MVEVNRSQGAAPATKPHEPELLQPRSLTVLLDTTNKCNLQCRMCWFSYDSHFHRPAQHMPVENFDAVARRVFPYARTLFLSAATEPLMHPRFAELLAIAARHEPPALKFLTNGQLLTPELSEECIRCRVNEIHVSIDGATAGSYEWIRRHASFDRLVGNLERLAECKRRRNSRLPLVQFNITLMQSNVAELGALARLAHRVGAERIACRHLVLFEGLGMENESLAANKVRANRLVARGLRAAAELGISVIQFPDFFTGEESDAQPWLSSDPGVSAVSPSEADIGLMHSAAGERPVGARLGGWLWRRLPAGYRWRLQQRRLYQQQSQAGHGPIGRWDEPSEDLIPAQEGLLLAGWALHREGIERITLCREPLPGAAAKQANELGLIPVGEARRHNGTRPDVAARYPGYPERHQAGWTIRLTQPHLRPLQAGMPLHAVAWGRDGRCAILGSRLLGPAAGALHPGSYYCRKPFDFVYIDPAANVFPHPECRTEAPFGSLAAQGSFEEIWHGRAFSELRRRIAASDPPEMCRACPDFINRRVDDPSYFVPRRID